ncbi:large-conductance mechanosensitive channel protein MscL [Estrella lausannensis]|uniref:Large-conductance mechanosensitive channel n=1 Tax=Estrella lausannensis TaxID=483423 RepID=A0A0H5DRB8_9BACT|nr:large-conductance mechanosensitive channel protein MscL [Estrella lausannensis]CRX38214.1 Large-conductance mechanosensitive channel [Estrella lausannensis]
MSLVSVLKEFKEFAMRGSVVDLAIGLIIGAEFSRIVDSFVTDIMMPPIGYLIGGVDFSNLAWTLTIGSADSAPVKINYGLFINHVINFLIIAVVVFAVVKGMNTLRKAQTKERATTKKCPDCQMDIPLDAKKCGHCWSEFNRKSAV